MNECTDVGGRGEGSIDPLLRFMNIFPLGSGFGVIYLYILRKRISYVAS